ncbi:MAG TPA: VOC family protein [Thermoplasmata archaeon]|nr:VOC family protein [Thermoplasmata archaeon]
MSGELPTQPGSIAWRDLTVPDATAVQRFYAAVVGWRAEPFEGDFNMFVPGGTAPVAGICHQRGPNANLPAQWLMYVTVADLERSVATATNLGGRVVDGPRSVGSGRLCVIQDPAGAVVALFQPGPSGRPTPV